MLRRNGASKTRSGYEAIWQSRYLRQAFDSSHWTLLRGRGRKHTRCLTDSMCTNPAAQTRDPWS